MGKHRLPAVLVAAFGLAALQIVGAGPAAADHTVLVDVDDRSCDKGTIALGIPIQLGPERAVVRTLRDGRIQTRCHFRGLPERVQHPDHPEWIRPARATRISKVSNCQLTGGGFNEVFGNAEAVITPAGTIKVTCTFTPPFGPPQA